MKLLLHPLAMPIYTFALYLEIERQSYVVDYISMIWLQASLLTMMLLVCYLSCRNFKDQSPLLNIHSTPLAKVILAIAMTAVYLFITFCFVVKRTNTWGASFTLLIYVIPTWLNIISGDAAARMFPSASDSFFARCNAAPPAYIGALSGYTIMIGYKTSADTFWPFVISLLMITLYATFCSKPADDTDNTDKNTPPSAAPQLYWYGIGIAQTVFLMYDA